MAADAAVERSSTPGEQPNNTEKLDEKHGDLEYPKLETVGEQAHEIDPEVEARVLRKIDLFLMPAMVIGTI